MKAMFLETGKDVKVELHVIMTSINSAMHGTKKLVLRV
jgi:hypothetical protein